MREKLHRVRNYIRRTGHDVARATDLSFEIEAPTRFIRNQVIGATMVVTGFSAALITYFSSHPLSFTPFIGGMITEFAGAGIMATEMAIHYATSWRHDAPARAERHRAGRMEDSLQTLHRAHGLTPQQAQTRSQLLTTIRTSDAVAMDRAGNCHADMIRSHNHRTKTFIDGLINEALRDDHKKISGALYERKEPSGKVQRGILFTHDYFATGKPATLFLLSAKTFSYAEQAAAENGVAFSTPPESLLNEISEATSSRLAIIASPPRPYALSVKMEARQALLKKEITTIERAMNEAARSGGFILFRDRHGQGIERGMIHLGDGLATSNYRITPLTPAAFSHAAQRATSMHSEFAVQSGDMRDIIGDYMEDHSSNNPTAPANRNWRTAIITSTASRLGRIA